jgi:hypothetical protein
MKMTEKFSARSFADLCRRVVAEWPQPVNLIGATDDEFQTLVINDLHHNIFVYTGQPDKYKRSEKERVEGSQLSYEAARNEVIEMVNEYSKGSFDPAPILDDAVRYALEAWHTRFKSKQ